jgi:Transcriptional regulatory protein, C terminal
MTWRELVVPQSIAAFIADIWMGVTVEEFNEESGEVKSFAPGHSTHPLVLDRSRYRPHDASTFPGELRDLRHQKVSKESPREGRNNRLPKAGMQRAQLTHRDDEVLSVLAAHPGRLFQRSELTAAAWGVRGADRIPELDQTMARIQRVLAAGPETVELVETAEGDTRFRLLIPHSGPGTESSP